MKTFFLLLAVSLPLLGCGNSSDDAPVATVCVIDPAHADRATMDAAVTAIAREISPQGNSIMQLTLNIISSAHGAKVNTTIPIDNSLGILSEQACQDSIKKYLGEHIANGDAEVTSQVATSILEEGVKTYNKGAGILCVIGNLPCGTSAPTVAPATEQSGKIFWYASARQNSLASISTVMSGANPDRFHNSATVNHRDCDASGQVYVFSPLGEAEAQMKATAIVDAAMSMGEIYITSAQESMIPVPNLENRSSAIQFIAEKLRKSRSADQVTTNYMLKDFSKNFRNFGSKLKSVFLLGNLSVNAQQAKLLPTFDIPSPASDSVAFWVSIGSQPETPRFQQAFVNRIRELGYAIRTFNE